MLVLMEKVQFGLNLRYEMYISYNAKQKEVIKCMNSIKIWRLPMWIAHI